VAKAEQAYRRRDAGEASKLMEAWVAYCERPAGNVVQTRETKNRPDYGRRLQQA